MASRLARSFEVVLLLAGLGALGLLVWSVGAKETTRLVELVGWWFVPIVLQEVVANAANTYGLLSCMALDRPQLGFWRTFAARLAGEGVNATMPTATVGGELLKISLLSRRAPALRVTAGIGAAYATQALAQMLFTALALPLSLPLLVAVPTAFRVLIQVFVLGGLVTTWWLATLTRKGAFGFAHGVLRKVRLGHEGSRAHEATEKIDDAARAADRTDPWGFTVSVASFLFGWAWGVVEVALVFHAWGLEVDLVQCLAIESLSTFVDAVFFFVPGQVGTREGGLTGITVLLGMGPEIGFALGLVRRGRVLAWAAIGYLCLAWLRREPSPERAEATNSPASPEPTPS